LVDLDFVKHLARELGEVDKGKPRIFPLMSTARCTGDSSVFRKMFERLRKMLEKMRVKITIMEMLRMMLAGTGHSSGGKWNSYSLYEEKFRRKARFSQN